MLSLKEEAEVLLSHFRSLPFRPSNPVCPMALELQWPQPNFLLGAEESNLGLLVRIVSTFAYWSLMPEGKALTAAAPLWPPRPLSLWVPCLSAPAYPSVGTSRDQLCSNCSCLALWGLQVLGAKMVS